jgi:hypothetical protein
MRRVRDVIDLLDVAPHPSANQPHVGLENGQSRIVPEGSICFIPLDFDPRAVFGKLRAPVKVTLNGLHRSRGHYIIEGSGTLVTGGTMLGATTVGPVAEIKDGVTRRVAPSAVRRAATEMTESRV